MYLNIQQDAYELYAANDGEFFRKFLLPTHPELDEVWSRMKDPRALHAMLNWDRANPVAKMYLAAIKEGVEIRHCRVPTLGIWSAGDRSEEHTSELQSLMRISYAVFCLHKTNKMLAIPLQLSAKTERDI